MGRVGQGQPRLYHPYSLKRLLQHPREHHQSGKQQLLMGSLFQEAVQGA